MNKISVIVLTRNSEKHLEKCINSILMQKYPDFEVIIIDSNSTDNTLSILNKYNSIKKQLEMVCSSKDISVGKARQIGVDNAKGEIIAFVDSDIELPHENWLKNMSEPLKDETVAGVQTLAKCKDSDPPILKKIHARFEYQDRIIDINNYQPIGTSHILLKKDILQNAGGIPDVFHGEDIVVMKRIMESGYKFVYLKEEKCYHYHVDSYFSHIKRQLRGIRNMIKDKLLR